jgi:ADP-ribose pyrophosphatase
VDGSSTDQPLPFTRQREVSVFSNRFGELFNDEVRSPRGVPARYLRWVWSAPGVVAVPRCGNRLAFVSTYRYSIGQPSLEFPRGGRDLGESAEDGAIRELREEAGLAAATVRQLGRVFADTGLIESPIDVFLCEIDDAIPTQPAAPEEMESIGSIAWLSHDGVAQAIRSGQIACGITLASLGLLLTLGESR